MLGVTSMPKGLKYIKCECSVGGKNFPVWYVTKQDPIQNALKSKTKTIDFKLMPFEMGSNLPVAI